MIQEDDMAHFDFENHGSIWRLWPLMGAVEKDVDLAELGRRLGCLRPWEEVAS